MPESIIIVDTETTGLSPEDDRIVEIAAIEVQPRVGTPIREFRRFTDPCMSMPQRALEIHGITNEHLSGAPLFSDIADDLIDFIQNKTLVMHNAKFDEGMLNGEFARCSRPTLDMLNVTLIDSIDLCKTLLPDRQSYALNEVCRYLGVDLQERALHGARVDVALLAQVIERLAPLFDRAAALRGSMPPVAKSQAFNRLIQLVDRTTVTQSQPSAEAFEEEYQRLKTLTDILGEIESQTKDFIKASFSAAREDFAEATVTRSTRKTVAWKSVYEQHFAHIDASSHTKESTSIRLTCKKQHDLEVAGTALLPELMQLAELHEAVRLHVAVGSLSAPIEKQLKRLMGDLLSCAEEGFKPQLVSIIESKQQTVSYKKIVESGGGLPDYEAFTKETSVLLIRENGFSRCEQLFAR